MLSDFSLSERIRWHTLQQCAAQAPHFTESAHAAKSAGCLMQGRADPAKQHVTILPALHVSRVVGNQAVYVLESVDDTQSPVECLVDTELDDGERLIESIAKARGGSRMDFGEGTGEAIELSLGKQGVFCLPGIAQRTGDARVQFLRQVIEDVT